MTTVLSSNAITQWAILFLMMLTCAVLCLAPLPGAAQSVNHKQIEKEGFGDVVKFFSALSPVQQREVMKLAHKKQQDLKRLSKKERQQQLQHARRLHRTIQWDKVDANQLIADYKAGKFELQPMQ